MYTVTYRPKNTSTPLSTNSTHSNQDLAEVAASAFLRMGDYASKFEVFISRPFVKVTLKTDPLIVEEVRY